MNPIKVYAGHGSSNVVAFRKKPISTSPVVESSAVDPSKVISEELIVAPALMSPGGLRLTTAPSSGHQFSYLEGANLYPYVPVQEPTVSVANAVRLASVACTAFSVLALVTYGIFGVIVLHPLIAGMLIIGSGTFYIMSKMRA